MMCLCQEVHPTVKFMPQYWMKVVWIMEDLIACANSCQGNRPAGSCPIQFGTVNVGKISGRET